MWRTQMCALIEWFAYLSYSSDWYSKLLQKCLNCYFGSWKDSSYLSNKQKKNKNLILETFGIFGHLLTYKETGRIFESINGIHVGWSNPLLSRFLCLRRRWYYNEKFDGDQFEAEVNWQGTLTWPAEYFLQVVQKAGAFFIGYTREWIIWVRILEVHHQLCQRAFYPKLVKLKKKTHTIKLLSFELPWT